jgi:hypothetical protein
MAPGIHYRHEDFVLLKVRAGEDTQKNPYASKLNYVVKTDVWDMTPCGLEDHYQRLKET